MLTGHIQHLSACALQTTIVLVGYSQGAQVTADVYQRDLTDAQRQMVAAIVLFGNPYFNRHDSAADRGATAADAAACSVSGRCLLPGHS